MTIVIHHLQPSFHLLQNKITACFFYTGADSPVIADSSTDANPLITSHHLESFLLVLR